MPTRTAITEKEIEKFAQTVLDGEKFNDWKFKWTNAKPGECWLKIKTIFIPRTIIGDYYWQAKEYVLHEIAHIKTLKQDHMHGTVFYKEYV